MARRQIIRGIVSLLPTIPAIQPSVARSLPDKPYEPGFAVPEDFGPIGVSAEQDTAALQSAIDSKRPVLLSPRTSYRIVRELTTPDAQVPLNMRCAAGHLSEAAVLTADPGFVGFMLRPKGSYHIDGLVLVGNGRDGCYGIGNDAAGTSGAGYIHNVRLGSLDIGVYFGSKWQNPLGLHYDKIYGQAFRSGGICLGGLSGEPSKGESAWDFGTIILTNAGTTGLELPAIQVDRANPTNDVISWQSSGGTMFGWLVMRSRDGTSDWHSPPNWSAATYLNTSFTAVKRMSETWNYKVVRQTVGIALRRGKILCSKVLQAEDFGIGLLTQDIFGYSIGAFYAEARNASPPRPSLAGTWSIRSQIHIDESWVDGFSYAHVSFAGSTLTAACVHAENCWVAAIGLGGAETQSFWSMRVLVSGRTPREYAPMTGSIYDHTREMTSNRGAKGDLEHVIDAPSRAGYSVFRRGAFGGRMGFDPNGEVELVASRPRFELPSKVIEAPLNNKSFFCPLKSGENAPFLEMLIDGERPMALQIPFMIVCELDGTAGQIISGTLEFTAVKYQGRVLADVAVGRTCKVAASGSISDPMFGVQIIADRCLLFCNMTGELSRSNLKIAVNAVSALGDVPTSMRLL